MPFESGIHGGLDPSRRLTIFGIVEKKAKNFSINLLKSNGDKVFHFNPRFDDKVRFLKKPSIHLCTGGTNNEYRGQN